MYLWKTMIVEHQLISISKSLVIAMNEMRKSRRKGKREDDDDEEEWWKEEKVRDRNLHFTKIETPYMQSPLCPKNICLIRWHCIMFQVSRLWHPMQDLCPGFVTAFSLTLKKKQTRSKQKTPLHPLAGCPKNHPKGHLWKLLPLTYILFPSFRANRP